MSDITTRVASREADHARTGSTSSRLPALDGLRGTAALIVVFHHVLLLAPGLARQYGGVNGGAPSPGQPWWFTQTPLHLLWGGTEAVYVFFVLSGYVLVLPLLYGRLSGRRLATWVAYYPQRVVRLYVPAITAGLLTVALVLLFPRREQPQLSWWYAGHNVDVSIGLVVRTLSLLAGPTTLNTPFWSLRWEVLFSLLLPVYVAGAVLTRRWAAGAVALTVAAVAVGASQLLPKSDFLFYLSMFAAGALLAASRDRVSAWAAHRGGGFWVCWGVVALGCFQPFWWWPAEPGLRAMSFVGACMVVLACVGCPSAVRWLSRGWAQWLGRISFSLYLLHEPLLVSVASLVRTGSVATDVALVLAIGLPLSLLAAESFFRLCEAPAHRWSKSVGRAAHHLSTTIRRQRVAEAASRPIGHQD